MKKGIVLWLALFLLTGILGCSSRRWTGEFAATSVTSFNGKTQTARVYCGGNKWRVESTTQKGIMILRLDKKIAWILMPEQKIYLEQKIDNEMLIGMSARLLDEIKRRKIGKEKVAGITCEKYEIAYKRDRGAKEKSIYQWISSDKIPLKAASLDGSWTSEYKNIIKGKQPARLFEIPAGYKKFKMPTGLFK